MQSKTRKILIVSHTASDAASLFTINDSHPPQRKTDTDTAVNHNNIALNTSDCFIFLTVVRLFFVVNSMQRYYKSYSVANR